MQEYNGIIQQLHKEMEEKIQEGHMEILKDIYPQLEDIHVKYDEIISKVRLIKD